AVESVLGGATDIRVPGSRRSRRRIERRNEPPRLATNKGEKSSNIKDAVSPRESIYLAIGHRVPIIGDAGYSVQGRYSAACLPTDVREVTTDVHRPTHRQDGL